MDKIIIRGAREHNLKNINLELPKNKLIVFTGVSGSGKSSLALDTIFAEGQRRYVESLSAYARHFLGQKGKPDVDSIEGLSPAISIDQKSASHNPRSTVATITEIYDYLRVLFARIGKPHCPKCHRQIEKMTVDEMIARILTMADSAKQAYPSRILAPVVKGRKGEYHQLLYDLYNEGFAKVIINGREHSLAEQISLARYLVHWIDLVVDELVLERDEDGRWSEGLILRLTEAVETAVKYGEGFLKIDKAGSEPLVLSTRFTCPDCDTSFIEIEPRLFSFNSPYGACPACHGLGTEYWWSEEPCQACEGARLRREALAVRIGGLSIWEIIQKTIGQATDWFARIELSKRERLIASRILDEIQNRLRFLVDVGLDYITLHRKAGTLAGGEAQRIRLASQVGSRLSGVLYVLDEPTIGLHPRDTARLLATLKRLRDLGNTVIIIEHDPETIWEADWLVDIGPGAGEAGGKIVTAGPLGDVLENGLASETVQYLRGDKRIEIPPARRKPKDQWLRVFGASEHNLKNINVSLPLGVFICVTGVSGSGKSTLVSEILYKALSRELMDARMRPGKHSRIEGIELLDKVIEIDQSPIGRTPRSNPATYTGTWTPIRELFATTPESRMRGYRPGRFSFNVPGGRCEACAGQGMVLIEMHFLPHVWIPCEVCQGKRFAAETLEVRYKSKNIHDILEMTCDEAFAFFEAIPPIADKLKMLRDVGLGYVRLGQAATTLSGGEAQRVKLSAELARRDTAKTLYVLDEPTVGLHFADVQKLLDVLQRLVSRGNTVIVIEHNLEVIKCADWIVDLGPEGGERGGEVVAEGRPEEIAKHPGSYTGRFLAKVLRGEKPVAEIT